MPQEEGIQAQRVFEQPADAISFYSDLAQVIATPNEVLLQFYETIPGPPGPDGLVQTARTRLRATVMLSRAHATRIGEIMREKLPEG
jgi:hypothetical protein